MRDGDVMRVGILDGGYDDACVVKWRWPTAGGQWRVPESRHLRPERLPMEEIATALDQEQGLGIVNGLQRRL